MRVMDPLSTYGMFHRRRRRSLFWSVAAVGAEMNKAEDIGNEAAQEALRIHRAN